MSANAATGTISVTRTGAAYILLLAQIYTGVASTSGLELIQEVIQDDPQVGTFNITVPGSVGLVMSNWNGGTSQALAPVGMRSWHAALGQSLVLDDQVFPDTGPNQTSSMPWTANVNTVFYSRAQLILQPAPPTSGYAAITPTISVSGNSGATATLSMPIRLEQGDAVVLFFHPGTNAGGLNPATVTGPGTQNWQDFGQVTVTTPANYFARMFVLTNANAASGDISITRTGAQFIIAVAQVYKNVVNAIPQVVQQTIIPANPALAPSSLAFMGSTIPNSVGVGGFSWAFGTSNGLTFVASRVSFIGSAQAAVLQDQLLPTPGEYQVILHWSSTSGSPMHSRIAVLLEPKLIQISISPTSADVIPGGTQQFTATVTGTSDQRVIWTASVGSIDSNGLFTAPLVSPTAGTVIARSVADPTVEAVATVNVLFPTHEVIVPVPGTDRADAINTGDVLTLPAAVTVNAGDVLVLGVQPGTSGSITLPVAVSGPGLQSWTHISSYVGGQNAQLWAVTHAVAATGTITISRTGVTGSLVGVFQAYRGVAAVIPYPVIAEQLDISPALAPGQTDFFDVTVSGSVGVGLFSFFSGTGQSLELPDANRVFFINSPNSSLVIQDAVFMSGLHQVSLTWSTPGFSGTWTAPTKLSLLLTPKSLAPPQPVEVSIFPPVATVVSEETKQFSATVTGAPGIDTGVVWTASEGTIDQTGFWTSPSVGSTIQATITATSIEDPTASASATVTIYPQSLFTFEPMGGGHFRLFRRSFIRRKKRGVVWEDSQMENEQ
jgi:hypothetical protein